MNPGRLWIVLAVAGALPAQNARLVKGESKAVHRTVLLTGEFLPYQTVDLHARVQGFVESVRVDRGSLVKQGDLLVSLSAPEMEAQAAEAEAKVKTAESTASEARAKLAAAESTYKRLQAASATEGAISGNELVIAKQAAEAQRDTVRAAESAITAAQASVAAVRKMQQYLTISAPFPGVITERLAHPGALAGPGTGPLLRLEQVSRLRLVVAVPEANFAGVRAGARVPFQVSAHPTRMFEAAVTRIARSIDQRTRTMPVELDVQNTSGALAPGMYPQLNWPVRSAEKVLLVPLTSVVRTTERVFVIRVREGRAEWVDVRAGAREAGQVQVFGNLAEGDAVVRLASDEIRDGTPIR